VLEGLAPYIDFHSVHIYTGSDDYYSNVLAPHQAERALRIAQALIDRVRYEQRIAHPIYVAYDEWNVWFRARRPETRLEERYTLADALAVATYLNVFIRHCQTVRIANLAQLVNVIAPIFTSPEGLFLQTIYHPLRLYAEHTREIALDPLVECETYTLDPEQETSPRPHRVADLGPFKYLDVAATCDQSGREVVLTVVNRHRDDPVEASIQIDGGLSLREGVAYEVNGAAPEVVNSFERPDAVGVSETRLEFAEGALTYSFPAHSLTVLRLQVGE
jgi:alpha-N-arabinofuranosidase